MRTLIALVVFLGFGNIQAQEAPEITSGQKYKRRVLLTVFWNESRDKNKEYLRATIADAFAAPLEKTGNFVILDRAASDLYLRAMRYSDSEIYDEDVAIRLGKAIGADVVVVGKFTSQRNLVSIESKAIDVQAGLLSVEDYADIKTNASMFHEINQLADRMSGPMAEKLQPLAGPPPPPEIALAELKNPRRAAEIQKAEKLAVEEKKAEKSSIFYHWAANAWKKEQVLRVAGALPYLLRTGDSQLNQYYGPGVGFLFEYQWYNIFFGGTYKSFWISEKSDLFQTASLQVYNADIGYLYQIPWQFEGFLGKWNFTLGVLARFAWAREIAADSTNNTFTAIGGVAKFGLHYHIAKSRSWLPDSLFFDLRYGFTPIGINKTNIEGIQLFAGGQWVLQ